MPAVNDEVLFRVEQSRLRNRGRDAIGDELKQPDVIFGKVS